MVSKAVARATPAFRPVLELVGETWHTPALLESSPRDRAPSDAIPPQPRPGPRPGTGTGNPSTGGGAADREFEW